MNNPDTAVYVFNSHIESDEAIKAPSRADFDLKNLSLVGKGHPSEEHPVGFYTAGDRIKA